MPFFCDSWAFQAQDLLTAVQRQQPHAVLASFRRFVEHVEQADVADVDATLNALVKSRRQVEAMLIFMEKTPNLGTIVVSWEFCHQCLENMVVQLDVHVSYGICKQLDQIWG